MSSRNDFIIEILNFVLDGDMSIMYQKVFLKKYVKQYINDNNKDEIINIIKEKNNDIYEYIFLSQYDKRKNNPDKLKKMNEINKKYYYNHKEELIEKSKENYKKKKEELNKLQKLVK